MLESVAKQEMWMGMLQKPYFQTSGMCSALTTAQCLWQSQALDASELYRTLLAPVLTQQHQQQVALRDGASGSPAADEVKHDQQSMFARVRVYCAKLFPVTRALFVPSHSGANPAVEVGDSHCVGTLDSQARGASQDAAMQPEADEAFRGDQSNGQAMGPGAHTSASADVFNLFDSPDDMTGDEKV
ncbi:TPA: hypothetical protein ACH3X2_007781 [Trebouxia sp. C0005]